MSMCDKGRKCEQSLSENYLYTTYTLYQLTVSNIKTSVALRFTIFPVVASFNDF